uniref:Uncharacterized protein n=1 Tax=viral metagenome TaxID=1070528 RepID=A0A6M3IXY2_9ZZZZ
MEMRYAKVENEWMTWKFREFIYGRCKVTMGRNFLAWLRVRYPEQCRYFMGE